MTYFSEIKFSWETSAFFGICMAPGFSILSLLFKISLCLDRASSWQLSASDKF